MTTAPFPPQNRLETQLWLQWGHSSTPVSLSLSTPGASMFIFGFPLMISGARADRFSFIVQEHDVFPDIWRYFSQQDWTVQCKVAPRNLSPCCKCTVISGFPFQATNVVATWCNQAMSGSKEFVEKGCKTLLSTWLKLSVSFTAAVAQVVEKIDSFLYFFKKFSL